MTRTSDYFRVQSQGSPHNPARPLGGPSSSPELSFASLWGCFASGVSASLAARLWAVLQFHSSLMILTSPPPCVILSYAMTIPTLEACALSPLSILPSLLQVPCPRWKELCTGSSHPVVFPQGCACPMTTPPRIPALLPILHKDPHLEFDRLWALWLSFHKSIIKHSRKFWSHYFSMESLFFSAFLMTSQSTSDQLNTGTKLLPNQSTLHLKQSGFQDCGRTAVTTHRRPTALKACDLYQDSHHTCVRYFSLIFFTGWHPDPWKSKLSTAASHLPSYLPSRSGCTVIPCQCSTRGKSGHRRCSGDTECWHSSHKSSCCPHQRRKQGTIPHTATVFSCCGMWKAILVIWLNLRDNSSHKQLWVIFRAWKPTLLPARCCHIYEKKNRIWILPCYGNKEPSSSFENLGESQPALKEGLENYTPCNEKGAAFTGPMNLIRYVNDWRVKRVKEECGDLTLH